MNDPHYSQLFDLTGKTVIVTGSGYGLGKQMALGLAACGANVVVSGRTQSKLLETVDLIHKGGGNAIAVAFDATSRDSCDTLITETLATYPKLDAMVINYGVITVSKPEDTSEEEWHRVVNTNLTSCFYCAQAAGKQMIAQGQGGSIVIISSSGSVVSFDGLSAYGASKGGVDQLSRQLASEWGKHGIRVNTMNPGYTTNPMADKPINTVDESVEQVMRQMTPLERRGAPQEFVGPVVFLVSDAASFVSGHTLMVDGGYCAR